MQGLRKKIKSYEDEQKAKLVQLGQSRKPYKDILVYLENEIKLSTKVIGFNYKILCFRDDGAYQLDKAITEIYGAAEPNDPKGPSGKQTVQTIDVILASGLRKKVPYGEINLPDLGDEAHISIAYNDAENELHITGKCEHRFMSMIDEIVDLTKELLNTESIYKDQAIELNSKCKPSILNLENIDKEFMVLSPKTEYELIPLKTRILQPEECRKKGIPLKTGILLEGPYGTGKTLLAFKIAQEAINNNWSFIYLKDPKLLARTLRLSQTLDNNGNGVVVFLEDVDQITSGSRDESLQEILNTIDGGDTKNMNVISLFTTNHIETIDPTFLRGKRIGSIISLTALDADTAYKFIEHTFRDYELQTEGLKEVCEEIAEAGIVPAFMAEITETIKSNMIFNSDNVVKPEYISNSLKSYLRQVELARTKTDYMSPELQLGNAMKQVILTGEISQDVKELKEALM